MNRREKYFDLYKEMAGISRPYKTKKPFVDRLFTLWEKKIGPALEVGAGNAFESVELSKKSAGGVIASDIITDRFINDNLLLPKIQFDATKPFPFRPGIFGCIYTGFFVHLLNNEEKKYFYKNVFEALAQNGVFVILTASENDLKRRLPARFFPSSFSIDIERYCTIGWNIGKMYDVGFSTVKSEKIVLDPVHVHEMTLYEKRLSSILRLIPYNEYKAGLKNMRSASSLGPIVQPWIRTLLVAKK